MDIMRIFIFLILIFFNEYSAEISYCEINDDDLIQLMDSLNLNSTSFEIQLENLPDQKTVQNDVLQLVIGLVECGNFSIALEYFRQFGDLEMLKQVIDATFKYPDKTDNAIAFVESLLFDHQKDESVMVMLDKIPTNNPYILKLDMLAKQWGGGLAAKKLKPYADRIIEEWAEQMLNEDLDRIKTFVLDNPDGVSIFEDYLPIVIHTAYNRTMVRRLLASMSSLPCHIHQVLGLEALFDEMYSRRHLDSVDAVELGARFKEISSSEAEAKMSTQAYEATLRLRRKLPDGIRTLLFDPYIIIESKKYHPRYTLYGSVHGNIYAYPHYNYEDGHNQMWSVDVLEHGRLFRFRNRANRRALYTDLKERAYSEPYKAMVKKQLWQVTPVGDAAEFTIMNMDKGKCRWLDVDDLKASFYSKDGLGSAVRAYSDRRGHKYQTWGILPV